MTLRTVQKITDQVLCGLNWANGGVTFGAQRQIAGTDRSDRSQRPSPKPMRSLFKSPKTAVTVEALNV